MKRLHLIGSSISLDNNFLLKGNQTRSFFTKEERARQTYNTIFSILTLYPQDTICLIDSSLDDVESLLTQSIYIQNKVQRFYIKNIDPSIAQIITTHHNKSYGESLMFKLFLTRYQESLSQFDFIIKHSGRYFVDNLFNLDMFNKETIDQVFFKPLQHFPHPENQEWGPPFRVPNQNPWDLYTLPTIIYAWGKEKMQAIIDMYDFVIENTKDTYYDGEHLINYYFHQNNITPYTVPWCVNGWGGQNGFFYRY